MTLNDKLDKEHFEFTILNKVNKDQLDLVYD